MPTDWDDVLAYTTGRKVRIRHRWVGGLYYFAVLRIIAYTVVYQVVLLRGYLMNIPITGSLHASVESADSTAPVASLAYCAQSGAPDDQLQLPCISFEPKAVQGCCTCCCHTCWARSGPTYCQLSQGSGRS